MGRLDSINDKGLYTDLLRKFRDNNHNLYVATPIERKYKQNSIKYKEDSVTFLKIKTGNLKKVSLTEKGVSTLLLEGIFLRAIKKYYSDVKFDLILYTTPPITFTRVINYVKKRDNAKSYLLLKDIFPQNAVDINLFKSNGIIDKFFRRKEKQLYKYSDYIGCMSPANVNFILNNNPEIPNDKVEVNPNTIEPQEVDVSESKKKEIRQKYKLPQNKSIYIYGGNLGKPQGIDFLIECIQKNEQNKDSYFLIVGSGTEFNKINGYFEKVRPTNAKLLKQLPKEDYELLANSCDVGLIFLDKRFTIPNFPSRLLSYMQASMPVLSATDSNTDIGKIIEEGNFGYSCISDDVEEFNDLVVQLSNKRLQKMMGKNARRCLEENYTSQHSYEIIMKHFENNGGSYDIFQE